MKRINIYLTVEQEEFLLSLKRESGASLAELVRRLITKKMGEVDEQTFESSEALEKAEKEINSETS